MTPECQLEEYPLHSSQRDIFLTSEDVMTILDPSLTITKLYEAVNQMSEFLYKPLFNRG